MIMFIFNSKKQSPSEICDEKLQKHYYTTHDFILKERDSPRGRKNVHNPLPRFY